ncbi:PDF receptor-like [Anticarsia gemmatalis]|uniref:PDF receptor-like n=1 Tax=Anticarsia gemmatalis TaxID=129554 RepID=UPI003F76BD39
MNLKKHRTTPNRACVMHARCRSRGDCSDGVACDTLAAVGSQGPYLCVAMYIILEYFITVMFMWMLNEGYYLHTLVTSNVLRGSNPYKFFLLLGWCAPVLITSAWATLAGIHYAQDTSLGCWYGYNFLTYFWVLEGPRLAVITINFLFLLNIMRVLILKLRQDNSSDVVKARKAVKAAMVLLPLLGITNILSMSEGPVGGPVWAFALWSYTTHFLRSFQGFALAMIYCLCNTEGPFDQPITKHNFTAWTGRIGPLRPADQTTHLHGVDRAYTALTDQPTLAMDRAH